MTTEQRQLLDEWVSCNGGQWSQAASAALAELDAYTEQMARITDEHRVWVKECYALRTLCAAQEEELRLLRAAGRIHGYLDELDNNGFACDCVVCREWRVKHCKEGR